ncbi:MAG: TA system VapC family ribonuclease toxin [Lentisphaeria bacterium]
MIAVDTNLLVYAHREDAPWHQEAMRVLAKLAEGPAPWAVPWPCVHEFLAIVTHPKIYRPPTPMGIAIKAVRAWMASPTLRLLGEGAGHLDQLEKLVLAAKAVGPMVHDARIAALCLNHGVRQFWSADRDFSRFPALKIRNPLIN